MLKPHRIAPAPEADADSYAQLVSAEAVDFPLP
jgi:hypothetical protein